MRWNVGTGTSGEVLPPSATPLTPPPYFSMSVDLYRAPMSRRHDIARRARRAVKGRTCLPPRGSSGLAGHSAVSSQRNREADEGAPTLPRLPAPHRRPAMRQWGHRCRQRPTLHSAPQGQRVRCTSACAKLDDFANCCADKVFTASPLDVTLLWEAHPCRGITLAHRKQYDLDIRVHTDQSPSL